MTKWELEVQKSLFRKESTAISELEKQYKKALGDINDKIKSFQTDIDLLDDAISQDGLDASAKALLLSRKRSKIYQQRYQESLKGQVSAIVDKLHGDSYATIDSYLRDCYTDGYTGAMYGIAQQGIPIIAPIDQAKAVRAVLTDSKISSGLYAALGVDAKKLKKQITQEISRGIASSLPYRDIARNISNVSGAPLNRAKVITRTEGHRIQQTATVDAQAAAKDAGCDILKQWDAALDKRTRPSHAKVDGEIRERDEPFSNGLMYPGDPNGKAAEVVNCRCVANTRARWSPDEAELQTLKERAEYFGLDKAGSFEEYRQKYLTAEDFFKKSVAKTENYAIIHPDRVISGHSPAPKSYMPGAVIDHVLDNGVVDARSFYGINGFKVKDIHPTDHGNPARHPYGKNGEHAHDYTWDSSGKLKSKTTREVDEKERKDNYDIL